MFLSKASYNKDEQKKYQDIHTGKSDFLYTFHFLDCFL